MTHNTPGPNAASWALLEKISSWKRRYLKDEGSLCPICRSGQIEGGSFDFEGNSVSQRVCCLECDNEWVDIYILSDVTLLSAIDPKDPSADRAGEPSYCPVCATEGIDNHQDDGSGLRTLVCPACSAVWSVTVMVVAGPKHIIQRGILS